PGFLAGVVARIGKAAGEEAHAVTRKVLEENTGDQHLALALGEALRHHALDQPGEIIRDRLLRQQGGRARTYRAQHPVALRPPQRIVQAGDRAAPDALQPRTVVLRLRHAQEGLAVERIDDVLADAGGLRPLTREEVAHRAGARAGHAVERIEGCEFGLAHGGSWGFPVASLKNAARIALAPW